MTERAQLVQPPSAEADHFDWSNVVHNRVDHPLTCSDATYPRLVQAKPWTTKNRPENPCNPSGPGWSLLRREALKPRAATSPRTSRAHNSHHQEISS